MPKPPEEHAENWDLRHEDFNDNDFLYDVYQTGPLITFRTIL